MKDKKSSRKMNKGLKQALTDEEMQMICLSGPNLIKPNI